MFRMNRIKFKQNLKNSNGKEKVSSVYFSFYASNNNNKTIDDSETFNQPRWISIEYF